MLPDWTFRLLDVFLLLMLAVPYGWLTERYGFGFRRTGALLIAMILVAANLVVRGG